MTAKLTDVREVLDNLRDAGITIYDIARRLDLYQVRTHPRQIKQWYSGKKTPMTVEFRAMRDLLNEVNKQ